jgi:hypothetical protein
LIVVETALYNSKSFTLRKLVEFSTTSVGYYNMNTYIFLPASYPSLRALHIETSGNELFLTQVCPFLPLLDTLSCDQFDVDDSDGRAEQILAPVENVLLTIKEQTIPSLADPPREIVLQALGKS